MPWQGEARNRNRKWKVRQLGRQVPYVMVGVDTSVSSVRFVYLVLYFNSIQLVRFN
jgi:hypothetical protein